MTEEIKNAKQPPRVFYMRHMCQGIAGYENENIFVPTDTIKKIMPSFVGKPIFVLHVDEVNPETVQGEMDGIVTDSFYNELDGWAWIKGMVLSDDGFDAIAKGWAVSNAYKPLEWGSSGQYLSVDYTRKILNAEFTHMAIVPNPRYDEAAILTPEEFKKYQDEKRKQLDELHNSKTKGTKMAFKLFTTKKQEITNSTEVDENTVIEVDGKEMKLSEIVNAVVKNAADEEEEKKNKAKKNSEGAELLNDDSEVSVGQEKMTMKDLMNKYNAIQKKNAEDAEDEAKKNAAEEEEKKNKKNAEDEEEKKNAKHFEELKNAAGQTKVVHVIETSHDKVQRGKDRY